MNKFALFAVAILITGTASLAADKHDSSSWDGQEEYEGGDADREPSSLVESFHAKHGPCSEVKLEDDQKAKIKDASFKFKESKIDLEAQVKRARLNYEKLISSPGADYKAAKAAAQEVADSESKMISAKQAFKAQLAFQILKPEQREPAMMCEKMMKRHWGHKKHSVEDHHGHGEDHHGDWG